MPATNLKSVSFKTLSALSASQRVKAFNSPDGRVIFSLLTPTQFAGLFPLYYMRQMPDASGFMKALPTSYTQAKQKMYEQQMERTVAGAKEGRTMGDLDTSTVTKTSRTYETFKRDGSKPSVSEASALAATKEEMDAYKKVQAGAIATDSAEAKIIGQLSAEQLSALHVEKYTDPQTHREMYRYNPPEPTQEEAKKALESGVPLSSSAEIKDKTGRVISTRSTNISPEERALLDTIASGEARTYNTLVGGGTFSDYSAHPTPGPSRAAGRYQFLGSTWRDVVSEYNRKNPNTPITDFSPEAQDRAALYLAQRDYARRTKGRDLMQDLRSEDPAIRNNIGEMLKSGLGGSGGNTTWQAFQLRGGPHWQQLYESNLERNKGYVESPKGPGGTYTKEQIDQQMLKMKQARPGDDRDQYAKQMFEMHKANANKPDAPQVDMSAVQTAAGGRISQSSSYQMTEDGYIIPKDPSLRGQGKFGYQQCATLGKAFNPAIEQSSMWNIKKNSFNEIKPGMTVATERYNLPGPDKTGAGYHTGVALTAPDKNGNFLILEQYKGKPAQVRQVSATQYPGGSLGGTTQFGVITSKDGKIIHDERSLAAMDAAIVLAPERYKKVLQEQRDTLYTEMQKGDVKEAKSNVAAIEQTLPGVPNKKEIAEQAGSATFQPKQTESTVSGLDVKDEKSKTITGKVETKDAVQQKALPTDPSQPAPEGYYWDLGKQGDKPKLISRETGKEVVRETAAAAPTPAATVTTPTTAGTPTFQPTQTQTKVTTSDVGTKPIVETKPVSPTEPSYTPGTPAAKAWENRPKFGEQTPTPATTATPAPTPATTATPAPTPATTATPAPAPPAKKEEPKAPTAAATPTPAPTPTAEPPKKEEPKKQEAPAPAHAGGGREKVDGPLSFADISPQRGDNTLVSDTSGKQFTMNKDKEVLQVNPNTNMADIKPTTSATIQAQSKVQSDMSPLPPPTPTPPMMAPTSAQEEQKGMQMTGGRRSQSTNSMQPTRDTNLIPELMDQSRQLLKNPSAMRAFARAGFGETGDVLDGNKHTYGNNSRA